MTDELLAAFRDADVSDLPVVGSIADPRLQALWTLHVGQSRAGIPMMAPNEIAVVLRDVYGIAVPRQRIEGILSLEKKSVSRRKSRKKKRAYQIMQAGIDEVEGVSSSVVLIEPEKALSSLRATETLLATLTGVVKFCDPYVDGRTIDLLAECTNAQSIELLTMNVKNTTMLKRDMRAFVQQYGLPLDVRVASGRTLHDRYAIDRDRMLLVGTSLNGIGFKQSFVVTVGEDIRASVLATFDSYWRAATPI